MRSTFSEEQARTGSATHRDRSFRHRQNHWPERPKIRSGYGLTQWAKIQNLKTVSQAVNFLTENRLLNMERLSDTITDTQQQLKDDTQQLLKVEARLKDVNLILKDLGVYHKFRPLYQEYLKTRKPQKSREQHIREILLYEGAGKFLREYQPDHKIKSFPAMPTLRSEKAELTAEQQRLYDRRKELKQSIQVMWSSLREFSGGLSSTEQMPPNYSSEAFAENGRQNG